ncbi:MAG: AzlD domain-containing protein [Bacillota bacterium]|nr:AzlD domain-containing protein [Bacillota bacterium]
MNRSMIFWMIFVSASITFLLRALPFVVFRNGKTMPQKLIYLGKILPSAIMAVLIVYCLKNVFTNFSDFGLSQIVASLVVVGTYKWKHNTLLSILLGTICNMILVTI